MIKKYSPEDFERCCELFVQVFNGPPWFDKWTDESARAHMRELTDSKQFLGFTAWDSGLAGAVLAHTHTFHSGTEIFIDDLFVSPDHRHKGLGTALMREVESYGERVSAASITLITGVGKPSFAFFEAFGCKHLDFLAYMHKRIK